MYVRKYEIIVLVNAEGGDASVEQTLGRVREALTSTGGTEVRLEDWGVRKLAYELRRQHKAHYLYLQFLGSNTTVAEMERLLGITEAVVKFQTIMLEDRIEADKFDFEKAKAQQTYIARNSREAQA
ncbi:MAG: 30S ribosomal protein S6 [Deltaproteobacteria bacterium]|nr:30S ribosomal protein S6 [Deltaproteobacteria bacterium]